MRQLLLATAAALVVFLFAGEVSAARKIIYFQGRSWGSWQSDQVNTANNALAWSNEAGFAFNGNARIHDAGVDALVRARLVTHCAGAGNECIVICYSAGCLRVLKAIDDLYAGGNTLPGLKWIEAAGSAAGGTRLAEVSTQGLTGFMAKLLGQQEAVDKDLTISAARSTYGYTQDAMQATPAFMYHSAGKNDVCKKILFFIKICGNKYVAPGGVGDGVIGLDSASGASSSAIISNGCTAAKYVDRVYEGLSPCGGEPRDHFGLVGRVLAITEHDIGSLGGVSGDKDYKWHDPGTVSHADCVGAQCDYGFEAGAAADFSKAVDQGSGAYVNVGVTDQSGQASATTGQTGTGDSCMGQCGIYSGARSCQCDAVCGSFGDCCGDYAAAHCAAVNQ